MKGVYIIPTGNEIEEGIVIDTDSPEVMQQIIRKHPTATVTRLGPLPDEENVIMSKLREVVACGPDLVVLIGGSGGGHRFSETLGKDFTQSALEKYLDIKSIREIYGKNGHLWCKLVCGLKDNTLIINVPGPYTEAKAAIKAFSDIYSTTNDLVAINEAMALAVFEQYPAQEVESS